MSERDGGALMDTIEIEVGPGRHLYNALKEAAALAGEKNATVTFGFNGTRHTVPPGVPFDEVLKAASKTVGHEILSPLATAAKAEEEAERTKAEWAKAIGDTGAMTEEQMRDAEVPWFDTMEDLTSYINSMVNRPHDYGTCVYAMSMAAVAAFRHVAHVLGVTGFQASCADLDVLKRTRHMEYGFRLVDYADMLYPQYWDEERTPVFRAALKDDRTRKRIAERARKELNEAADAAPTVLKHWERLAAL